MSLADVLATVESIKQQIEDQLSQIASFKTKTEDSITLVTSELEGDNAGHEQRMLAALSQALDSLGGAESALNESADGCQQVSKTRNRSTAMPALANVVVAAQQIGSNATQLSTGTSATAQSLSQKADELQSVTAPNQTGESAAQQVRTASQALESCAAAMSQLSSAVDDFVQHAQQ